MFWTPLLARHRRDACATFNGWIGVLVVVIASAFALHAHAAGVLQLNDPSSGRTLGYITDQQTVECLFTITNISEKTVHLQVDACHFCPQPTLSKNVLEPGEMTGLILEVHPQGQRGLINASATVNVEGEPSEGVTAAVTAEVRPRVWTQPWQVSLKGVRGKGGEARARLTGHLPKSVDPNGFRVVSVMCDAPGITSAVVDPIQVDDLGEPAWAQEVVFKIAADAPLGKTTTRAIMTTNDPASPNAGVRIDVDMQGVVGIEPQSVYVHAVQSKPFESKFDLVSRDGRRIDIESIEVAENADATKVVLDVLPDLATGNMHVRVRGVAPGSPRQFVNLVVRIVVRGENEEQSIDIPIGMQVQAPLIEQ